MKYITEDDLRDIYRKEPFTDYNLEPGERLTPGARQFLMDRGINVIDSDYSSTGNNVSVKPKDPLTEKKDDYKNNGLYCKMKSIDALFLLTEEELLSRDICLVQNVIKLSKQFSCIMNSVKNNASVDNLCCMECTGINNDNFSEDLDDCFEVTEFHIQLEKGREIVVLHRLRCELNELKLMIREQYEDSDDGSQTSKDMIGKVNQIINSLSRLICSAFGGKKCQRLN